MARPRSYNIRLSANSKYERLSRPPANETFFSLPCPKCHRELIGNKETKGRAWCARCQQWRTKGVTANA